MRPNYFEWEQVQLEMKDRKYKAKQERRHANGIKVRKKGTAQPWKARGISKATYYRLGLHHETPEVPLYHLT